MMAAFYVALCFDKKEEEFEGQILPLFLFLEMNNEKIKRRSFSNLILNIFFFSIFYSPSFSQIQLGNNINGDFEGDDFGRAISISSDGNRVTIGAPMNSLGYK